MKWSESITKIAQSTYLGSHNFSTKKIMIIVNNDDDNTI